MLSGGAYSRESSGKLYALKEWWNLCDEEFLKALVKDIANKQSERFHIGMGYVNQAIRGMHLPSDKASSNVPSNFPLYSQYKLPCATHNVETDEHMREGPLPGWGKLLIFILMENWGLKDWIFPHLQHPVRRGCRQLWAGRRESYF